jgi:DNA processing protein
VLGLIEEPLGPSPVPVDEIMRVSGASSGAVQIALLEMDLAG